MTNNFLPATGKAWQYISTKGGIEKNLKINPSVTLPTPKPNQHLVRVIAACLNPVDYKPAEVQLISRLAIPKPATPGIDFVGRIMVPASGTSFKRDQLVFGTAGGTSPLAAGALSEFAVASTDGVAALPEGVDPIDAGTIGVAGLTAYQTIVPNVQKGSKIFINGGSGGTGVFGIQIAKAVGCYVATACSAANFELCKSLGADLVVDYRKQNVVDALNASGHKFDHVVDNICTDLELYWRCHEYTRPGTVFMKIAGAPTFGYMWNSFKMSFWPGVLGGGKRKVKGFLTAPKADELARIAAWMKEGKVKTIIDTRYPFEQAPDAFRKLKTGRTRGKLVIDVSADTSK
ncbi:MAG: hypothetical protein M1820_003228 [Bogoriella megaspora]|nr:MAG: hypothetical protein M1820_003228 [Bogoriella megaspora]